MGRWGVAAAAAGVVIALAGVPAVAAGTPFSALLGYGSSAQDDDPREPHAHAKHPGPPPWAHSGRGHAYGHGHGHGHGKPPWADGGQRPKTEGPDRDASKLSPAQHRRLMRQLTTTHAEGMKAWTACKAHGRDDCVRHAPPGHAKRQ